MEAGEGVNLNFIFKREPKDKILSKIAQTAMVDRSQMQDMEDAQSGFNALTSTRPGLPGGGYRDPGGTAADVWKDFE